jgi:peptidyl-prolyl cis-trans isomerase D
MLSFFRRFTHSKLGVIITFIVLGVIALAFAAGDVTGLAGNATSGLTGNNVATVGSEKITSAGLKARVQSELEAARQRQPTATMEQLLAQGGLQGVLEREINTLALEQFAKRNGMAVSKRSVDGQIASIPGLQGPNGQFDPAIYQRLLGERKLTDAQVRGDIARDTLSQALILPTIGATQVGEQIALPYASLLLEKRSGQVGFVPTKAMATGAAPTDADIQAFYTRNRARYSLPERRVIRYALVTPAIIAARAVPTDAEIAQAYAQQRPRFAAKQTRTISQVVIADLAGANALAAKVKAGASIADAARAAGLEPLTQTGVEKPAYAQTASPAVADAVFAAPQGAVIGPVRGALGWIVAKVDSINQVAGKSLEQARPELVTVLTQQKSQAALGAIHDALDDSLSKNATFDEAVTDQKLSPLTTQPLVANGTNPTTPGAAADPALAQIVAAGFQAAEGDAPQLVTMGQDGSFAVVAIGRVLPAAPRPIAEVRATVAQDVATDRARAAARVLAATILAKVNQGTPLAQALAGSGHALPPTQPITASRGELADQRRAQPPLVMLFSMRQGTAKMLEAPGNAGWFLIKLDRIEPGNAAGKPDIVKSTRTDLGRAVGNEYVQQFARAVRLNVGSKTDAAAVARVRAELSGAGN